MRYPVALSCLCFALTTSAAEDPKPPKTMSDVRIGYAIAKVDGKRIAVTLKVLDTKWEDVVYAKLVNEPVTKIVDGKPVTETKPVEKVFTMRKLVPVGFREVKLIAADVKAKELDGTAVPPRKLPDLLSTETPVLIVTGADAIEAHHLATTKPGTLILHVDPAKVFPTLK